MSIITVDNLSLLTENDDNEMKIFLKKEEKMKNNMIMVDKSDIIDSKVCFGLHDLLPRYMQSKRWYLYYSKSRHGSSFET